MVTNVVNSSFKKLYKKKEQLKHSKQNIYCCAIYNIIIYKTLDDEQIWTKRKKCLKKYNYVIDYI